MTRSLFRYFKTSREIIQLAVMSYIRFPLSLSNVEDLLYERGIDVCHEGEVLEAYVTKTRDKAAALNFLRKAMKRYGMTSLLTKPNPSQLVPNAPSPK